MNCWTILSPGSSSLLVISCIDVTSLSCGAWMTNRMLPSTHSRQPNFPTTFNCSPSRWEERTALKNTDQNDITKNISTCPQKTAAVGKCAATWWGHWALLGESPVWLAWTCRQQNYTPLRLPLQRQHTHKHAHRTDDHQSTFTLQKQPKFYVFFPFCIL